MGKKKTPLEKKLHLKNCSYTRNGVYYPYFAIAESVSEEGKNQKRIIKYLGAITPKEQESYRVLIDKLNTGNPNIVDFQNIRFVEQKDFLNVATLHTIWNRIGLNSIFPHSDLKKISTAQIAEILTVARLLRPSSNLQTINWLKKTYLPELLGISICDYNRMKIFNELDLIQNASPRIEEQLMSYSKKFGEKQFEIFFVDGTTSFFEGTDCPLGRRGKDKTNGYKTHMILIMLVTNQEGFPCAWEVFSGDKKEISEFRGVLFRISKNYNISNTTFCFDRGFASAGNFDAIEGLNAKFISGIDSDQIEKVFDIKAFQGTRTKLLERTSSEVEFIPNSPIKRTPIDGFYSADNERFYRELGHKKGEHRHVVGFSSEIYYAESKKRENSQQQALLEIAAFNEELAHTKRDRDLNVAERIIEEIIKKYGMTKIISFTLIPIKVMNNNRALQSGKIETKVNTVEFNKASNLDGLFVYVTDHIEKSASNDQYTLSAHNLIMHYKNKYIIESDFRDLKNVIDIRPLFVRLPQHVKAVVTICMISQYLNVYITQKLKVLGMALSEFYNLLNSSASVATMSTNERSFAKQIQIPERLKAALAALEISNVSWEDYITANPI